MALKTPNSIWRIASPPTFERVGALVIILITIHIASGQTPTLRLTGIVSVDDYENAIIEIHEPETSRPSHLDGGNRERGKGSSANADLLVPVPLILRTSERLDQLLVRTINAAAGSTEVSYLGSNYVISLDSGTWAGRGVFLTNALFDAVMNVYSELAGLTLLRHPNLPDGRMTVISSASTAESACREISQAFTNYGIVVVPDGEKFEQIVPLSEVGKVIPRSKVLTPATNNVSTNDLLKAGQINFISAHPVQVAAIYAELAGRKLRPGASVLPMMDIQLLNHNSLTREEAVYALDVLFAWRGVKLEPVGTNLLDFAPVAGP